MIKAVNVISDTNIGGAGKCVLTFLKYHSPQTDVITVIPRGSLLTEHIKALGAEYIELDGLADKSFDMKAVGKLRKIFSEIKPDIIHCHAAMAARIAGRLYGKAKIIYTRHSVFEPSPTISVGLGKIINGFVNNITADKIIAVAEAAKDNLLKTGVSEKKIVVIKNGVESLKALTEEQKLAVRKNYGINPDDFVLGIAARLNKVKGHVYILKALKMLIDDGIPAKLIIAGTGECEEEIRSQISEYKLDDAVIMAGFVDDVTNLMNILDVNVNASFGTEATSLALLEGMSLGVPSVVSDFGGNPGVVTDGVNGYIYPTCDFEKMYEKLKLVYADSSKLRKSSKQVFEKNFKAQVMTEKIEKLYNELAERKQ